MGVTGIVEAPKVERPKLALMFCAVSAFAILGMLAIFIMYDNLAYRGLRGDDLIIPFVMSLVFTSSIAGLLIWQLARMITAYKEAERRVIVEKQYIREAPPAQLGAPADPSQQSVEPPSVVEHTTRQFAGKYRG